MPRRAQRQIIAVYVLQVMALGLAGSLLGVVLARAAIAAIPLCARSDRRRSWRSRSTASRASAAAQGIGVGVLVSLLFSVVPLLHVRIVRPSLLLRDEAASRAVATGPESARWCWCRRRWSR